MPHALRNDEVQECGRRREVVRQSPGLHRKSQCQACKNQQRKPQLAVADCPQQSQQGKSQRRTKVELPPLFDLHRAALEESAERATVLETPEFPAIKKAENFVMISGLRLWRL